MHNSNAEHSVPQLVDGYKIYNVNGAPFELPAYYTLLKPLGMGAYGVVCSCLDTRTGAKVAIKKNLQCVTRDLEDGKRVLREISLMRFFNGHKNIMPLLDILPPRGVDAASKKAKMKDIYLVLPLLDVDMNVILRSRQQLEMNHYQYFIYQLLCALSALHKSRVCHRDLKPANLMTNISCELKLCDFGLARELDNLDSTLTDYVVTRWYRPPELLLQETSYTTAVDIWSAGIIFLEFFTRKPLFPARTSIEELRQLAAAFGKPRYMPEEQAMMDPAALRLLSSLPDTQMKPLSQICPKLTDPLGQDFVSHMLEMDPKKRWTADQLIAHEFLNGVRDPPNPQQANNKQAPPAQPFHWEYETKHRMTMEDLRNGFWKEICRFHPELEQQ